MKNIEIIGRKTKAMNIRDILKKAETTEDREEYDRTHSRPFKFDDFGALVESWSKPKEEIKKENAET